MPTLHFLNVRNGDCSIIQHASGRVTVIDVCNASAPHDTGTASFGAFRAEDRAVSGNSQQKRYPANPIAYLVEHGVSSVFRYIQTHPDMDHLDGIEDFFRAFSPKNFWDTDNQEEKDLGPRAPYREADWRFYKSLRDGRPQVNTKRLTIAANSRGLFYNQPNGGDGLHVLAPTPDLVSQANLNGDYNDASYVILYRALGGHRTVFGGDSHDNTWDYVLNHHETEVTDVDLLIAPHHGRSSNRSYEFLDVLAPTLTFFGNARHEYLAYDAWNRRGLQKVTNNQANCMVVDASQNPMDLYVTNEKFARRVNESTKYVGEFQAWYAYPIEQ